MVEHSPNAQVIIFDQWAMCDGGSVSRPHSYSTIFVCVFVCIVSLFAMHDVKMHVVQENPLRWKLSTCVGPLCL